MPPTYLVARLLRLRCQFRGRFWNSAPTSHARDSPLRVRLARRLRLSFEAMIAGLGEPLNDWLGVDGNVMTQVGPASGPSARRLEAIAVDDDDDGAALLGDAARGTSENLFLGGSLQHQVGTQVAAGAPLLVAGNAGALSDPRAAQESETAMRSCCVCQRMAERSPTKAPSG